MTVEDSVNAVSAPNKCTSSPDAFDVTPDQDGGVLKEIKREGKGEDTPVPGDRVFVHYTGTLLDGTKFDSSVDRGEQFEFVLGKGEVIKAWDIGVATMKKGEVSIFTCKPEYAYGKAGSPPKIPPDATLVFEIGLFDWKGEDLTASKDGGIIRKMLIKPEGYQSPNQGATVEIHSVGRYDGNTFEDRHISFILGEGSEQSVCSGVEQALEQFKKGEKSILKLKPKYAYGKTGNLNYNIPPDADVEFEIELKSFEKAKEPWELDITEKLEQAEICKAKGTKYFQEGKYSLAQKQYKRIISYLEFEKSGAGDHPLEKKDQLLLAGHLNMAACYLKTKQLNEVREHCNKALEIKPDSEKAFFRRGQALLNMNENEAAKQDFEKVIQLDPNNKAALNQIGVCVSRAKLQKEKDRRIYANMFDKFAKIDAQKEANKWAKLDDPMINPGEWDHLKGDKSNTDKSSENINGEDQGCEERTIA